MAPTNPITLIRPEDIATIATGWYFKNISLGVWDMDANQTISVAHGETLGLFYLLSVMIRNDAGTLYHPFLLGSDGSSVNMRGALKDINSTNIILVRETGGLFDSTDYDDTGITRGYAILLVKGV